VLFIVEDLHWVDPSTLEFLNLLVDQSPTARIMVLMTYRPEFTPPWPSRAHLTPLTLSRLPRPQVERMVASVAGAKVLPRDVVQQIVAKTDGVPLFVEELTKTVLESGLLREHADHYELTGPLPALAIPATLQDSLMARLDRLSTVKMVAQLGATIGRQFAYDLLQTISPLDEDALQPELLAHHYTEAGLAEQAIPYWQRAAERAVQRSANVEAIGHLTQGITLLKQLEETPERLQQELVFQTALGPVLMVTKGYAALEVEQTYERARELCQQVGEAPQLFSALWGTWYFYAVRPELQKSIELARQLFSLAQRAHDSTLLMVAHRILGANLIQQGELAPGLEHLRQGLALYNLQQHRALVFVYGQDIGVVCKQWSAWTLWLLGYPDQALQMTRDTLQMAHEVSHP
jgi:predicted ATPase